MKIHHVGIVVKNIDKYLNNMPFKIVLNDVYDEIQKARLVLIEFDNAYLELIEPKEKDSFTYNFLKKGGGLHHICYETTKQNAEEIVRKNKMIKVLDWVYAPLLNSDVMFAYSKNKELIEFKDIHERVN